MTYSPPADADITAAWAWQAQRRGAPGLGPLSGIPSGDLAVSWLGQPDKIAYIGIKAATADSLTGASLELAIDGDAPNIDVEGAQIHACVVVLEWEPAEPMAWDAKPPTVCDTAAPGRYEAAANSFVFALSPLAPALGSPAAYGVSIEPVETPESSFQVVFQGEIRLSLSSRSAGAPAAASEFVEPTTVGPVFEPPDSAEGIYVPVPNASSAPPADTTPQDALAVAAPPRSESRPVSLSGVYGMLVLLACLLLAGRVVAHLVRSRREDER